MGLKKKHHEEHENLERWLVSYADFITLLFAFFTVLYAISQKDKKTYQKTVENIQRAFLSAGGIFPLKGSPFTPFEKPQDTGSVVPPSPTEPGNQSKNETGGEQSDRIQEQLQGVFQKTTGLSNKPGDIEVIKTNDGFKIRLAEEILFKPKSERLRREHIPFLFEVGKQLGKLGHKIQVEGHTDASEGSEEKSAWEMSLARAYNILKFMVEGVEFPQDKIALAAFGDTQPIADNKTKEGRAKNRRVEITVILPDQNIPELFF
jgi:chemotaxis protein MotB